MATMAMSRSISKRLVSSPSTWSRRLYHSYDHAAPLGPFSNAQCRILAAALGHVGKYGFTLTTLGLGANEAGYIDASTHLFPDAAFSLVHYHLYTQRLALAACPPPPSADVESRIRAYTWERLRANHQVIGRWPEALALAALPRNVPVALNELSLLVDDIHFLAGDASVDTSWYTKRASLATIYASTELFMTGDKSPDYKDTRDFLERRFKAMDSVGSSLSAIAEWGNFTASAAINVLRSKGMRV
ncbi:Bgt-1672 [Blumeria graminis f. sp. tritici]|uniref:Ubiquinone biosynthesis protein n=2 Tax=Blumeria graminis f. sp. tritici TaxID=62690 RepID=A0A9X9QDL9_BLUGR|nr:hypothetical protein BGT96224_1672 [Blumeria graminis f. sp. tritici 96224]VDB89072.1 Bgt-1672 [Blumeria graminis f. sp. tritici]